MGVGNVFGLLPDNCWIGIDSPLLPDKCWLGVDEILGLLSDTLKVPGGWNIISMVRYDADK